jgi:hypothetical protein
MFDATFMAQKMLPSAIEKCGRNECACGKPKKSNMQMCPVLQSLALGSVLFCVTSQTALGADKPVPADIIIFNAKVLTVDSNSTVASAIAVRGDRIVAIGRDRQIQKLKGPETHVIDAQGQTVMPGLYDNLVDSYQASVSELNGPLPDLDSIENAQKFIRDEAAGKTNGAWIIVERAYPTRMKEGRLPTKAELDAAAPKNPVYWNCGDLAMLNTKAIEISGITAMTPSPSGGEIVLDPATHAPSGLLRHASSLLKLPAAAASPTAQQRREALKQLYALYNQEGITSIGESQADSEAINLFRDMAASNELTVRINCTRYVAPGTNMEDTLAHLDALTNAASGKTPYGPTGVGDDWVRIGPLLAKVDGSLTSGGSYMRTPWGIGPMFQISEPAYRGALQADPDFLTAYFIAAAKRGWQITADCTGDAALDQLLNCFQKVQFKTDITKSRFLIRHATFQAHQDWDRCRELGLGAEMQPTILYCDGSALLKTLGEKRLRYFEAYRGWLDAGLAIGAGSGHEARLDSRNVANPWSPWLGIWVAVTRSTAQNDGICVKDQQLTREEAIQFYTMNNARLHFENEKKGSLEVGKFADLVLLDRDILKCPVDDIRETKVKLTLVGGKAVWGELPQALFPKPDELQVTALKPTTP